MTNPPSSEAEGADDPFDALLNLEEQYYSEGYQLGVADGERAGLIEGRWFGLQKGFEKGVEMGRIFGRAQVLGARVGMGRGSKSQPRVQVQAQSGAGEAFAGNEGGENVQDGGLSELLQSEREMRVRPLRYSERLERHITALYALSEIESLDTRNTEEAVTEFDDRFKRAVAKAKVIESIIGDGHGDGEREFVSTDSPGGSGVGGKGKGRIRLTRDTTGLEKNIEDFGIR